MHGLQGGEVNESTRVVEESLANIGASVMGRNMFGGHPGPWGAKKPWNGWWGVNPPFHHPVFVLTHHAREPLELEGGTTFTFVTDGIEAALAQARAAAGEAPVAIAGGAATVNQYLAAGAIDELRLHVAPVVLGAGEGLFDGVGDLTLEPLGVGGTDLVTHLNYRLSGTLRCTARRRAS
jgi:dihydrofolate reductase